MRHVVLQVPYGARIIPRPSASLREEIFKMDVFLPECQYLQPSLKLTARIKQWTQACDIPEDAGIFCLEILRFMGTLALIVVIGLIMLMAG
jgi:hypothetical protein